MKEKIINFLKKYYVAFIIIIASFLFDLITKVIATNNLTYTLNDNGDLLFSTPKVLIDGFFYLTYARNTGGGWSIFAGEMWFFYIATIIAIGIFSYLLKDFNLKKRPLISIGIALMLGGTLGNFFDRIVYGYVTDFFDFYIFGYDYPIFNIADICLVIGGILVLIQIVFFYKQLENKNDQIAEK